MTSSSVDHHIILARLIRTLRSRRAAAAQKVRDLLWLGCKKDRAEVAWLPDREEDDRGNPDREAGWYLVADLGDSFMEVGIDWCSWCGGRLDPIAGERGQNAFEIVLRQPLRGFLRPSERADWPGGDFRPGEES